MSIALLTRLPLAAVLGACAASRAHPQGPAPDCLVARVVDGDTFYCRDGRKVRLIGVDSPERGQGAAAHEAQQALGRLAPLDRAVRLEGDVAPTDRYGRVLAWVWSGGTLVNAAELHRSPEREVCRPDQPGAKSSPRSARRPLGHRRLRLPA